ncbi:hypothetical protein EDEG_02484 [Edhazardia aedis USNM 41457]|uniref:Uncharacterized protein n=1 Tax=Edhazardia aedis (strain USNM 41457) TaxID=1003232 RepID=J9D5U3_EDHAE|nr:hypothetical protein EDEG_02484 [Edhazardia aedis USNM 41457]|eukprot:EJW03146.1 hypothetical protein EDEG_02484 [Edhazardia aedis USNM 41457]
MEILIQIAYQKSHHLKFHTQTMLVENKFKIYKYVRIKMHRYRKNKNKNRMITIFNKSEGTTIPLYHIFSISHINTFLNRSMDYGAFYKYYIRNVFIFENRKILRKFRLYIFLICEEFLFSKFFLKYLQNLQI